MALMRMFRASIWVLVAALAIELPRAFTEDAPIPGTFDLVLVSFDNKNQAVKAVHDISGMSVKDSTALVEAVPKAILAGVTKDEAEKAGKHAEALACKVEIRAAQPGASPGPVHKFELVLQKAGPSSADVAKAVASVTGKEAAEAQQFLKALPVTLAGDLMLGIGDGKAAVLQAAGCTAELVSTGGVEGGVSVVLNKVDPAKKIITIATIREHTGLNIARAKALAETLPHTVKIKISQDEAQKIKAALEADKAVVTVK